MQRAVALEGVRRGQVIVAQSQTACEIVAEGDHESNPDEASHRDQSHFGSRHQPTASCASCVASDPSCSESRIRLNDIIIESIYLSGRV